jgi:hypothetical protein
MSALRQPTPGDAPSVAALPATRREALDAIREAYTFVDESNEAAALGILARRPDVAAALLQALPHISAIFGDDRRVLLVAIDYHTDEPLGLTVLIDTTGTVSERLMKQQRFYQDWWLSVPGEIADVLSFSV